MRQITRKNGKWPVIAGLLAATFGTLLGQSPLDPLPDWVRQLAKVKLHLKENFERIPNYVCQENVERFERTAGRSQAAKVDSLQFEVAQVEHKELLALPGAGGFEDKELTAYMSAGLLGSGQFSAMPINLFVSNHARITPHAEGVDGAPAGLSYDFEIPAFLNAFTLAAPGVRVSVGVRGTFWVDPQSLDLIRVEEHAVDIPPVLGMNAVTSTAEYGRMRIGNSSVLLPQSGELAVRNLDGTERHNRVRFSACREYGSESTVTFGDQAEPSPVAKKK
jgi:hypothetical protein